MILPFSLSVVTIPISAHDPVHRLDDLGVVRLGGSKFGPSGEAVRDPRKDVDLGHRPIFK